MTKDLKKIEIIIPKGATTNVELGLVMLTEALEKAGYSISGGLLGGEYGYGGYYESDVFMMHPFCWCDKEDCKWCDADEHGVSGDDGAPNFHYKPTDCKIWWYKYIGRSQEKKGKLPSNWLKECLKDIGRPDGRPRKEKDE